MNKFFFLVSLKLNLIGCSIVEINATFGETVILPCPLTRGNFTIQWIKVDTLTIVSNDGILNPRVAESGRLEILVNKKENEYDLQIKNTTISDEGLYQCEGIIDGKPKSSQIVLYLFKKFTNVFIVQGNLGNTSANFTTNVNRNGFSLFLPVSIVGSCLILVLTFSTMISLLLKKKEKFTTHRETMTHITTNEIQESVQINTTPVSHPPTINCTTTYQTLLHNPQADLPYDELI